VPAPASRHRPKQRLTLDTPEDLDLIRRIFEVLYPVRPDFGLDDMLALLDRNPDWIAINAEVQHRWVKR
jgi:spore coat polysaccharide biosynthesis protein SpsF